MITDRQIRDIHASLLEKARVNQSASEEHMDPEVDIVEFAKAVIEATTPKWFPKTKDTLGSYLVYMPDEKQGRRLAVGHFHPNVSIVDGHFAFDMSPVTHCMALPEEPQQPSE